MQSSEKQNHNQTNLKLKHMIMAKELQLITEHRKHILFQMTAISFTNLPQDGFIKKN